MVDGYNVIFAWEELKSLAKTSMDAARTALIEILSNYQGYRRCKVIIVFDAYKIKIVSDVRKSTVCRWCLRKKARLPILI